MHHVSGDRRATEAHAPRVLMFSQRNIHEPVVWRCSFSEFEDIIPEIDSVDLVAPTPRPWYANGRRVAFRLGKHFTAPLNPGIPVVTPSKYYDLFFAVVEQPAELWNLNAVRGWKDYCKTSVCWVTEFYAKDIARYKSSLEVLSKFDHVLFMFDASESFRKAIRGQGHYLAAGIDTLRFSPHPTPPSRCIDVLSIGRRSGKTHRALLELARQEGLFYVYDTIDDLHGFDLAEHRSLMANMAKRSRYFLVNPGKIDRPDETGGQSEFGYRYFEGAAAGAILIGERANNKEFRRVFHWEDAVIDLPFNSEDIGAIMKELDTQPERQARIRQTNIAECLSNHDWAYRWETVLALAGLEPLPDLRKRKQRLKDLAAAALQHTGEATAGAAGRRTEDAAV